MTHSRPYKALFEFDADVKRKTLKFIMAPETPNPRAVNIFAHILAAEKMWLGRLQLGVKAPPPELWPSATPESLQGDLDSIVDHWARLLEGPDADDPDRQVHYLTVKGDTVCDRASDIMTHVIIHSAYHRGQVTAITGGGEKQAPSADYIFFARRQAPPDTAAATK